MKQRENALPGRIVPKNLKTKDVVVLLSPSPLSLLLMMQRTKHYCLSLPLINPLWRRWSQHSWYAPGMYLSEEQVPKEESL